MHKLHHYHIYDVINTSLPWAGRVWRGRVINTCPRSPSLCSAVPLFGRPFDRPDTNDLISTSPAPARLRRGGEASRLADSIVAPELSFTYYLRATVPRNES